MNLDTKKVVSKHDLKIKEYSEQLGGVKKKYLEIENSLNQNVGIYHLQKIIEIKNELKTHASQMRKLAVKLRKLGVIIDLEQR